jgi:Tol biopolymer transport system component/predicted Ser/Thr protein kinase
MPLDPGKRLGPYEIKAALGAGGMGEVYEARDTRLGRTVAVKVLPSHLSDDPVRQERFEREARTISSLSHPHICALYDVGHEEGLHYLVMEYIEGENLAERLSRGPLPTEQVLRFGAEIADALDEAHRRGVVHRDLKPANIMLTGSGVKLLDFGLAKAMAAADPDGGTALPTRTHELTQEGTILGTFHYMAPEQLEGREADARSDIFALGAVLFEMLTGRKAFSGESQASLIASIMTSSPPSVSSLQPLTPRALDRVVQGCMARSPEDRWSTAHDVMLQLRWIGEGGSAEDPQPPGVKRRGTRERLWVTTAAVLALVAAGLAFAWLRQPAAQPRVVRASINPPEGYRILSGGPAAGALTVSPDGRYVTFPVWSPEDAEPRLWVRALDEADARPLAGTEWMEYPFWSTDSRFIGFLAEGKLRKIPVEGGPVVTLCDADNIRGATWNSDGVILFNRHWRDSIYRVSADGGTPERVTQLDEQGGETTHRWPHFLPDGRHFLYLAGSHEADVTSGDNAIYLASIDSPGRELLLRARSQVVYASGHLLYTRNQELLAHPFDADRLELTGDPVTIARGVSYEKGFFQGVFDVSLNGVLAFRRGGAETRTELVWFNRQGNELSVLGEPATMFSLSFSPDHSQLAVALGDTSDLWLVDLERGGRTRLTSHPMDEFVPVWSPDGSTVAYASNERGEPDVLSIPVRGGAAPLTLMATDAAEVPSDYSPDGKYLSFSRSERLKGAMTSHSDGQHASIWMIPQDGEQEPFAFLATEFSNWDGQFSPDGHWLAYDSDSSGQVEIYVTRFPEGGERWLVSRGGGEGARWRADGRELFYVTNNGTLTAVPVKTDSDGFEAGTPQALFRTDFMWRYAPVYAPSVDGQRFLVNRLELNTEPISLVTNWTAALPGR